MVENNHKLTSKENDAKKPEQQRQIVKLQNFEPHMFLRNCTLSKTKKDYGYGLSYILFYDDKLTFVNEKTVLGQELKDIYDRLGNSKFDIELKEFMKNGFRGFNVLSVVYQ